MKTKHVKQGYCPKCGGDDLDYGAPDWRDGAVDFPFSCKDCKFSGSENYIMEFAGFEGSDYEFYEAGSHIEAEVITKRKSK